MIHMFGDSIVASFLWLIIMILVIIALAYWFTRYMAGHGAFGVVARLGGGLEVLAQLPMGRDQRLVVVQAGERYFLLGVTAAEITLLTEFTEEEAAVWKQQSNAASNSGGQLSPPAFREAFSRLLQKNRRR